MYFLNYVWSFECCWAYSNGWIQQDGIHQRNLKKLINIFHFRILCLVCITSRGTIAGTGTRWSTSTSIGYRPTWHLSKKYFWYGALDFMLIYELLKWLNISYYECIYKDLPYLNNSWCRFSNSIFAAQGDEKYCQ